MQTTTIHIPRINDGHLDFYTLSNLWNQLNSANINTHIVLDFSNCDFLCPTALVFLGGATRLIQSLGGLISFSIQSMQSRVKMNLLQNGFAFAMGADTGPWKGNSIPYQEYSEPNKDYIIKYLKDDWLGRGWINISSNLKNEIAGRMWEIFANAFEHSLAKNGIISCGQYFKTKKTLVLAVADFGIGIPSNVKNFSGNTQLLPSEAMKWAFTKGNSTSKMLETPRGVGLDLLKEFVQVSHGTLGIYSHGGYAHIDHDGEIYDNHPAYFEGTIVQVSLSCDDNYYCLADEVNTAEYF